MTSATRRSSPRPATFAELLRSARLDAHLTQEQLAQRLGVRSVTVSRWESGRSGVVQARLRRVVADFLQLPIRDLYALLGLDPSDPNVRPLMSVVDSEVQPAAPEVLEEPVAEPSRAQVLEAITSRIATGEQLTTHEAAVHASLLRAVGLVVPPDSDFGLWE